MKTCFLLGSGAAVPAGFSTVAAITEKIFSESNQPTPWSVNCGVPADGDRKLLRWLEIQIKRRYESEGSQAVHYENIFFLAKQLRDDLIGEYDNPAIRPFIESAIEQVLPRLPSLSGDAYKELQLVAEHLTKLIRQCVVSLLSPKPTRLDHLEFVVEAIAGADADQTKPSVLTLNHDTHVESVLTGKVDYMDGFTKEPNCVGIREWQPRQLVDQSKAIRILKLHGGIDWYRFRPDGVQTHHEDYFGIPTSKYDPSKSRDGQGRLHSRMDDSLPVFLIGSWDKLASYTDPIYLEIYYAAFEALRTAELLVVVGYGFGDKGINKLITDWMCGSERHRLVVIDLKANSLRQRARGAIALRWHGWLSTKQLVPIEFDLCNTTRLSWEQIRAALLRTVYGAEL